MRFRIKPIEVEAFQWTGGPDQTEDPTWIIEAMRQGSVRFQAAGTKSVRMEISGVDGRVFARPGDWIVFDPTAKRSPIRAVDAGEFHHLFEAAP